MSGIVIDNVRIIDGTGAPPVTGRVVVEGERIVAAGSAAGAPPYGSPIAIPHDAEVIDGTGRTVLPGLVDVHVHDASDENMALYVRSGVTAIRFAGGRQRSLLDLRARIERGDIPGPRVFSCGHPLDGTPHVWPGGYAVDSPIEARLVVRRAVEVDHVDAVLATHRVTRVVLAAIVDAAHELGIPVTGQIWGASGRDAAEVGMDGLDNTSRIPEHPSFTPERLHERLTVSGRIATLAHLWNAMDRERLLELAGLLADRGVALSPQLVSFEAWAGLADAEVKADREWPSSADDPRARQWDQHNRYISGEWTREDFAAQERAIERYKEFCVAFLEAGGGLATGTDLGFGGVLIHRELRHFNDAGLTPLQAIRAGTRQAASFLGRDDLGFLSPGKTADLVIVAGDPTIDLGALRNVERTIIGGRTVWRHAPALAVAR